MPPRGEMVIDERLLNDRESARSRTGISLEDPFGELPSVEQAEEATNDETILLDAAIAGDIHAFGRLYDRHRPILLARCHRVLRDPGAAEDVVQETFLRACRNLHAFDRSKRLWPWLATIALRLSIDVLRRRSHEYCAEDSPDKPDPFSRGVEPGDPAFDAFSATEQRRHLARALSQLPARQRRVLLLHALEGWSYADIAAVEGSTISSVKSLIFRARGALRRACEGVLGIAAIPARSIRLRIDRATVRARLALSNARAEGIVIGIQQIAAAVLAIALAVGSAAQGPRELPLVSSQSPTSRAATPRTAAADVAEPGLRAGLPVDHASTPRPLSADGAAQDLVDDVLNPADGATPENVQFTSIAPSPNFASDGTVYAAGGVSCPQTRCPVLFVSEDGGATWSRLSAQGFSGGDILLTPDHSASNPIFAAGPSGLQMSGNGGARFDPASPVVGGAAVSPEFDADPRILISSSSVFEYRADQGTTAPAQIAAVPGAPGTIAFSPQYGTDGVVVVGGVKPAEDGTLRSTVYRCEDELCQDSGLPGNAGAPGVELSATFADDGIAYAFTSESLYFSSDGAASFTALALPASAQGALADVVLLPDAGSGGPAIAIASLRSPGLHVSTDGGQTWTTQEIDLPGFESGVSRVAVAPGGRLFAAAAKRGIACSDDGGLTWASQCPLP